MQAGHDPGLQQHPRQIRVRLGQGRAPVLATGAVITSASGGITSADPHRNRTLTGAGVLSLGWISHTIHTGTMTKTSGPISATVSRRRDPATMALPICPIVA